MKISKSKFMAGIQSFNPAGDRLKKAVRPRARRKLAGWAQEAYRISERHAARIVKLAIREDSAVSESEGVR